MPSRFRSRLASKLSGMMDKQFVEQAIQFRVGVGTHAVVRVESQGGDDVGEGVSAVVFPEPTAKATERFFVVVGGEELAFPDPCTATTPAPTPRDGLNLDLHPLAI